MSIFQLIFEDKNVSQSSEKRIIAIDAIKN